MQFRVSLARRNTQPIVDPSELGWLSAPPHHFAGVQAGEYTGIGVTFAVIMLSLWAALQQAARPADSAVLLVFKQAEAGLAHFAVLQRTGVTEELDLVIAIGSPMALPIGQTTWTGWSEERKIGLFLQEKMHPERIYSLGTKPGYRDCAARIERVTATDSVISCEGGKSERYPYQKWVYDVRAKKLLAQFSYQPFAMYRVFPSAGGAVFVGSDTERLVAVEYRPDREPAFRVLSEAEAPRVIQIEEDRAPPIPEIPPLPQTTYDQFAAARPRRVKDGYVRESTEIHDSVGPWQ